MAVETSIQKNYFQQSLLWSTALLAATHMAGLAGLLWPVTQPYFLKLVPMQLLLTTGIVLWFHGPLNRFFVSFMSCIFLGGFLVEVIGVKTGAIFGNYIYGSTLGWQVAGVPVLIGCNWFVLVYGAGTVSRKITSRKAWQPVVAALLMVGLDVFIEPVATRLHFWNWQSGIIPLQNYIGWFICSFFFQLLFQKWIQESPKKIAMLVFLIQGAFFISGTLLFYFF